MVAKCETVGSGSNIGVSIDKHILQRPVIEVTWGWSHFRVVEIRQS